jgi:hypothetical protein
MAEPDEPTGSGLTAAGSAQVSWAGLDAETLQKIRHMPGVVRHLVVKANETIEMAAGGAGDFDVLLSDDPDNVRPRAYVKPANSAGIRLELSQSVLLKAAVSMEGK